RQLAGLGYQCAVFLLDLGKNLKGSSAINWQRLEEQGKVQLAKIQHIGDFPGIQPSDILIDGLFGSGLSRPLERLPAEIVHKINALRNMVVAV
ncbi:NAD(P)H-hydrate epimerase, partial [Nocardia farcinica]|uniref:NAD(P)H-hydrate epimerase n=1 Tax=Nocardia farcinica TaxID=37329 RepID=UPI001895A91E